MQQRSQVRIKNRIEEKEKLKVGKPEILLQKKIFRKQNKEHRGKNLSNRIDKAGSRLKGFKFTAIVYTKENKSNYIAGIYRLYLTIWKEEFNTS